ncbi:MAG: ABC transporter permease [Candidatus Omnitrophica bacterium]|nr:ABC transporter permease [Candidatus Omnitrophota bacterium]
MQFLRNVPLLIIVLYASTLDIHTAGQVTMDLHNYPVAVYDRDHSSQSRDIISKLRRPYFDVTYNINDENRIRDLIEAGKVAVVLVFPHNFAKNITAYRTAQMQVILDGSKSNASQLALRYIANIVQQYNLNLTFTKWKVSKIAKDTLPYVNYSIRYFYNPNLIDRWSFCLQEFLMIMSLIGVLLTATAMVNEKQFGTIEQLMVTPLRTHEIMISKIVPMVCILFVATFISIFVILIPVEGIPLLGNVWAFFFVSLIYFFTVAGLGLFISTISKNLSETVLFSILVLVPIMFLSGAWVAMEVMPKWVQFLVHLSPLKYYLDLTNGIFFKGTSLFAMWRWVVSLIAIGAVVFTAGAIRFRRVFQ